MCLTFSARLKRHQNQIYHGASIIYEESVLNSLRALLAAFCVVFLLVGCSHFESDEEEAVLEEEEATPEQIVLYQQGEGGEWAEPEQTPAAL